MYTEAELRSMWTKYQKSAKKYPPSDYKNYVEFKKSVIKGWDKISTQKKRDKELKRILGKRNL